MSAFAATVRRGGGWLPMIGLLSVVDAAGQLALPAALGRCVDAVVAGHDLGPWVAAVAGLIVVSVVADVLDAYAGAACVSRTTAWLRDTLDGTRWPLGRRVPTGSTPATSSAGSARTAPTRPRPGPPSWSSAPR
ncbi:hypothetical protein ACFQX7_33865 [Luedemannella flava]